MSESRFDEIIMKFITKYRSEGAQQNAVTISSKRLEIDNTTRSIEQQLNECRTSVIETLKSYESTTIALDNMETQCSKLATKGNELKDFEHNLVRPRIIEIEKIRDVIRAKMNSDENHNRQLEKRQCEKKSEIIQNLNSLRSELHAEIEIIEQDTKNLAAQIEDTAQRTKFLKAE